MSKRQRVRNDQPGSAAVEYGLMAAATALALVAILPALVAALSATLLN